MTDETLLSYVIVGAVLDFPVPSTLKRFAGDVDVLAIDAAPEWRDRPHGVLGRLPFARVQTLEGLVGDGERKSYHRAVFSLSSSTRPSAETFRNWTSCRTDMRIRWSTGNAANKTTAMDSRPLSELARDHGLASVDFVYTDIEGADLEALVSLGDMLGQQVVGVDSETQLEAMFEGQPLFPDLHAVMREAGFLVRDLSLGNWSPFRSFSGLGGGGFPISGHVRYIKHPDRLETMADPVMASLKAALLAISDTDLDYAATAVAAILKNPAHGARARDLLFSPKREWMAFLGEFIRVAQAGSGVIFPDFIAGRFGDPISPDQLETIRLHATDRPTQVEDLLRKYDLDDTAAAAADQRVLAARETLKMLSQR